MKYCNKCILPDTRPNLKINDKGLCNSKCSLDKVINGIKDLKNLKFLLIK